MVASFLPQIMVPFIAIHAGAVMIAFFLYVEKEETT